MAGVSENYDNVKSMLNQLNIEAIQFLVGDVKILMIFVRKSSAKPKHGCPFCSAYSPYEENGTLSHLSHAMKMI